MNFLKASAALLILVVTNAFVFGGILWNRSGEATGRIVFDQCELNSFKDWSGRHGTARYVHLNFESLKVDENSLENLGGLDEEGKHLERKAYVVAKHGGPEWQNFVGRRERLGLYSGVEHSKLILVDGDIDPERLLEKYPATEGRAVLPGYVGGRYWSGEGSKDYYWHTAADSIAIDSRYRAIVKDIRDARLALEEEANRNVSQFVNPPCAPTHRITVNWGRRFEPWITSIEAM